MKPDKRFPPWGDWENQLGKHGYEQLTDWKGRFVYKRPTDSFYLHDKMGRPG